MAFGDFFKKFKLNDPLEERSETNQISTESHDGAVETENPDFLSQYQLPMEWTYTDQVELINTYREIANYSIVDFAIEDIVGEMVSFDEDQNPIELDLSDIDDKELSQNVKEMIHESFEKVSKILDLKTSIHRRAKQFYIDGRMAYQKVVDPNKMKEGLLNAIELDSRCITKIRNVEYDTDNRTIKNVKETYIYDEEAPKRQGSGNKRTEKQKMHKHALQLNPESISYVTTGLTDPKTGYAISWLHKAVRPANQLRMMENALLIYRITRAPERRVFYVDTRGLQKTKAEQYIRRLKNNYRNKMSYDPESGSFKDTRHLQTMQEDFWLPRNSDGRGTEVNTLPGGQNLDQISDIVYFQKELYKSLNLPVSRLENNSFMPLGRASEISRDELKLSKFVSKIRKRFNILLTDLLKTDIILRNILTSKEWYNIEHKIKFKYALDMYIEERKQMEMIRDRLDLLREMEPYIGKYISHESARRDVLKQTDQDIVEEDEKMEKEQTNPQYNPSEDD